MFHYYILVTDLEILLFVCGVTKMTALIRQGTYMYGYLSCLCVDAVIVIYTTLVSFPLPVLQYWRWA